KTLYKDVMLETFKNLTDIGKMVKFTSRFKIRGQTTIGKFMILKSILKVLEDVEVVFNHIKEYIQERNPMNVISVVMVLHIIVVFTSIKEFILKSNLVSVGKISC
ncbi:hypothetical protein U0070_000117, partial [Myodes glareolus]